ncbi:hypothetical protein M9H77_13875 [Catharanthus roseus]|uniref:Uncharacterized protein n=1 Tax=Catharanthus roseus TaxID=4058 RepID=A0ACC0BLP0_CATRO|nr:hypothetical protein M9H77_13875 [Catharanthus roseus]
MELKLQTSPHQSVVNGPLFLPHKSYKVEREVRNIQRDAGDIQGDEERDEVMAESEKIAEVAVRNVVRIVRRSRSTKGVYKET